MNVLDLFSGIGGFSLGLERAMAYPSGQGLERFEPHQGILGRALASLAKHGHDAFDPWRSLVGGEPICGGGHGLSVAMERRRLHGPGNAVVPIIPEIIGREIMKVHRP